MVNEKQQYGQNIRQTEWVQGSRTISKQQMKKKWTISMTGSDGKILIYDNLTAQDMFLPNQGCNDATDNNKSHPE